MLGSLKSVVEGGGRGGGVLGSKVLRRGPGVLRSKVLRRGGVRIYSVEERGVLGSKVLIANIM